MLKLVKISFPTLRKFSQFQPKLNMLKINFNKLFLLNLKKSNLTNWTKQITVQFNTNTKEIYGSKS